MKQEDKELLLKDLCARLPYGVRVKTDFYPEPIHIGAIEINQFPTDIDLWPMTPLDVNGSNLKLDDVLLYLRPMSSMTDKEQEEFMALFDDSWSIEPTIKSLKFALRSISNVNDWLNQHHFDYRGLIEKELALEAPEGMYNTKD